jgi:hypothetical protein
MLYLTVDDNLKGNANRGDVRKSTTTRVEIRSWDLAACKKFTHAFALVTRHWKVP